MPRRQGFKVRSGKGRSTYDILLGKAGRFDPSYRLRDLTMFWRKK